MEIRDGPEGPDGPVQYLSYCARHARPQPHLSGKPSACLAAAREQLTGTHTPRQLVALTLPPPLSPSFCAGVRLVSESEEQGDLPEQQLPSSLCNGQPYQLPAQAPLPACPAGAARAMPILTWQRQQHGTGTGASSVAAYWIPGQPQAMDAPRRRQRAAGRLAPGPAMAAPTREGSGIDAGEAARAGAAAADVARAAAGAAQPGNEAHAAALAAAKPWLAADVPAQASTLQAPAAAAAAAAASGPGRGRWGGGRGSGGRGRGRGRWGGRGGRSTAATPVAALDPCLEPPEYVSEPLLRCLCGCVRLGVLGSSCVWKHALLCRSICTQC